MSWTLKLKFDKDDTEYSADILEGATLKECVGEKGKHATQSCSLSIYDPILAAKIFNATENVDAKIMNGTDCFFEGIIRPYATLSAEMNRENPIQLEVIDYTEILRSYIYTNLDGIDGLTEEERAKCIESRVWTNKTVNGIIHDLLDLSKVKGKVSYVIPGSGAAATDIPYFSLEAGKYLDDIIEDFLYNYSYDFRFTPGKLTVFSTAVVDKDHVATPATVDLSSFNLSFEVERDDVSKDGIKLSYGDYHSIRSIIYSSYWCGDSHGESIFRDEDIGFYFKNSFHDGDTLDYGENVSWVLSDTFKNKTILSVSNIAVSGWIGTMQKNAIGVSAGIGAYDNDGGQPYLKYTKAEGFKGRYLIGSASMTVRGTVSYKDNDSVVENILGLDPESYTAEYVEDVTSARLLATNIQARNERAAYHYSFSTFTAVDPGTFVSIKENAVTGLTTTARIVSRIYNPVTGLYQYEAEGAGDVTVKEIFTSVNGNTPSDIGQEYLMELTTTRSTFLYEKLQTATVTASGLVFTRYQCTPKWTLNDTELSDTTTEITIKNSQLNVGVNILKCTATIDDADIEREIELDLVKAEAEKGEDGTYLSFDVSRTIVDFYADGIPVDDSEIVFTAKSDLDATLSINGTAKTTGKSITYKEKPSSLFTLGNSITAMAETAKMQQSYTLALNKYAGSLTLSADKTNIAFYADNIAHDTSDKITLTVASENYYYAPKLYLNGVLQATEDSASYTFEVPQSAFANERDITVKVTCGSESQMLTLSKVMDTGSISIAADKSEIGYYADNVPLNNTETAIVSVTQSGFSKLPTLTINGVEKEYTSTVLTDSATYTIKASDLANISKITAQISIVNEIQAITVNKTMEQATIALSVSEGVAEYYYDNVAITGNMTATVSYSGLYYPPLLKAGETSIVLDTDGHGAIPISLFDNVDNGLVITAYAQKYISYSTSVNIPKTKRPLVLSLGNSGSQFSYDNEGTASPASITLTNYTSGLSDKGLVTLVVGGVLKSWTDGTFTVTPDMVTGRFLTVTVSYGNESSSLIITKTYDGKAEIIEYSKTKSFTIYPDEEYEFTYNDTGVVYNGETMAWVDPWSTTQPDISSNEYLWRRSRNSDTAAWQYTRITGIKGDDGKAGEYLGHYTEAPTKKPDGSDINDGDYYLNTSELGAPLPYIYKSGEWTLVTADNPMWSQIAAATMGDVNDYGGALLSTSAYYGYFQALTAQKAFIKSLGAQEITLNEGGSIKSANYDSTNGAEGFKIDADGNCNFATGTWRGSFANGLSFIPETNLTVKKTMTHKEVYEMMKKAGIVEGIYQIGDASTPINDATGTSNTIAHLQRYNSVQNDGTGFNITEYGNNLSCAIPLMCSTSSGFIPLTVNTYLMFKIEVTSTTNNDVTTYTLKSVNAYLVNKSMVANNSNYYMNGITEDDADLLKYPVDISSWQISGFIKDDIVAIYGTAVDGKIVIVTGTNTFSVYSVDETAMSLALEGTFTCSDNFHPTRWLLPSFSYHKKDGYYELPFYNNDTQQFIFRQTTDLLTYTDVGTAYTFSAPTGARDMLPLDIIKVGTRIFAQCFEEFERNDDVIIRYYFVEYNSTTQQFDQIPDNYTCIEGLNSINIVPLSEKDGIIIGTFSGYDLFTYNTNTNVFTDISDIFMGALPYWTQFEEGGAQQRLYTVSPSTRCYRSDNDNADSKKYSKTMYNPNISINAIQYSTLYDCYLISARIESNSGIMGGIPIYMTYKYYIDTGEAELMSPMVCSTSNIPNIAPYIEDSDGNYTISAGMYILTSQVDSSDYLNVELANISSADLLEYNNGDKTMAALFGVNDISSIPWWIREVIKDDSMMAIFFTGDKMRYNKNCIFNTDDERIKFYEPYPLVGIKKVAIREDEDSYKILDLDFIFYMHLSNGIIFNLCGGINYSNYIGWHIHTNGAGIEPLITIKKDSTEQLGISFYWDFPAQLTIREDIKKVIKADIFKEYVYTN